MALPSSGPISLKQVREELKLNGSINLGQQEVRNLAKIPSGRISLNDLKGKSTELQPQDCDYYFETKEDFGNRIEQICKNHNYDLSNVTLGFSDNVTELTYNFLNYYSAVYLKSTFYASFPKELKASPKMIIAKNLSKAGYIKSISFDNNCFYGIFNYCKSLTYISENLFKYCKNIISFDYCFAYNSIISIPQNLFENCCNITSFNNCFNSCDSLTSIPSHLFKNCSNVIDFSGCFGNCIIIKLIPEGLFDNCTKVTNFANCFNSCYELTTVPFNLFDNCKNVTNFYCCFGFSSNITSALPDVWNKSKFPKVTNGSFYARDCTKASNYSKIPNDFINM